MRTVHEVIASVCQMPSEFHRSGDVSILHLAEDPDYREHQSAFGVEDIQRYLQAHPELVLGRWIRDHVRFSLRLPLLFELPRFRRTES